MKKLFLWIMAWLAVLPMVSFAQNIGDIDVSFCNSWIDSDSYFTLITEAWKTENLCVNIKNHSQKPVSIHIDFVDWGISYWGESACFAPDYTQKEFSKYIAQFDTDLDLQWWEEIQKDYELQYPIWFSWLSHGCVSYYINSEDYSEGMALIIRKVNIIDVLVWGTEVSSRIKINNIFYTWTIDSNKLWFNIENNGNIDQEVTISWYVDWWFKYSESFDLWSFILKAGESVLVYTNELHIPWYKWRFHANSYISNEPNVDFSIAHSNIYDNEYSVAGTVLVHVPFFLWNWMLVALLILVAALIVALIWRFSKGKKKSKK